MFHFYLWPPYSILHLWPHFTYGLSPLLTHFTYGLSPLLTHFTYGLSPLLSSLHFWPHFTSGLTSPLSSLHLFTLSSLLYSPHFSIHLTFLFTGTPIPQKVKAPHSNVPNHKDSINMSSVITNPLKMQSWIDLLNSHDANYRSHVSKIFSISLSLSTYLLLSLYIFSPLLSTLLSPVQSLHIN